MFITFKNKVLKSLQHNGIKESDMTPKDRWRQKEKALRTKFLVLFLLSHLAWPLLNSEPSRIPTLPEAPKIEKNHQIVNLSLRSLVKSPPAYQKRPVTLVHRVSKKQIHGFLHHQEEDSLSPLSFNQIKATLELPIDTLVLISTKEEEWTLYPRLQEISFAPKSSSQQRRKVYEINF